MLQQSSPCSLLRNKMDQITRTSEKTTSEEIEDLKHVDTLVAFHRQPRPSDRPEDPLNWPMMLKVSCDRPYNVMYTRADC